MGHCFQRDKATLCVFSWNFGLTYFKKKKSIKMKWNHCSFCSSSLHHIIQKFRRVGGANASRSAEHGMSCLAKSRLCCRAVSELPFSFGPQWLSQTETLRVFFSFPPLSALLKVIEEPLRDTSTSAPERANNCAKRLALMAAFKKGTMAQKHKLWGFLFCFVFPLNHNYPKIKGWLMCRINSEHHCLEFRL